jgi:hypothetical protein
MKHNALKERNRITVMKFTEWIPLINSYPLWARIVILICGAIIVSVLVLAREVNQESKQGASNGSVVGNQNAGTINNVFQGVPQTLTPSADPLLSAAQQRLLGFSSIIRLNMRHIS